MGDVNPFADPEAANPFVDPSVQQAAAGGQRNLNDYNPFEESNKVPTQTPAQQPRLAPPPRPNEVSQPAVMQPTEAPPAYSPSAAQSAVNTDDLQRRQEELERKAAELQRKEQEMRQAQYGERQNNFPPLPKFCCVGPCFYQDFSVDIPLEFQRIVKICYYYWIFHTVVLIINLISSLAYFITVASAAGVNTGAGTTFGLSILWVVLFAPCSFLCWYRPVYKAFRSDSSFNFFMFFFVMFFQFICCIIQCIGIDGNTVGWINSLTMMGVNIGVGIMMMVTAVLFTLSAVASILLLIRVHRLYRSTGASFKKAQAEFAGGVMKNEAVQNAAGQAAQGAVRNMAGASDNRY